MNKNLLPPCFKYIYRVLDVKDELSTNVFTKQFISTLRSHKIDDLSISMYLRTLPFNGKSAPLFTYKGRVRTGTDFFDEMINDNELKTMSCTEYFKKCCSSLDVCLTCPYSSEYSNSNLNAEYRILSFGLSSPVNLKILEEKLNDIEDLVFTSIIDVHSYNSMSKPLLIEANYLFYFSMLSTRDSLFPKTGTPRAALAKELKRLIDRNDILNPGEEFSDMAAQNLVGSILNDCSMENTIPLASEIDEIINAIKNETLSYKGASYNNQSQPAPIEVNQDTADTSTNISNNPDTFDSENNTTSLIDYYNNMLSEGNIEMAKVPSKEENLFDDSDDELPFGAAEVVTADTVIENDLFTSDNDITADTDDFESLISDEVNKPETPIVVRESQSAEETSAPSNKPTSNLKTVSRKYSPDGDDILFSPYITTKELFYRAIELGTDAKIWAQFENTIDRQGSKVLYLESCYDENNTDFLLFYNERTDKYYYTYLDILYIQDCLMPYLSHKSVRLVTFNPYRLYSICREHKLQVRGVMSLYTAYLVLYKNKDCLNYTDILRKISGSKIKDTLRQGAYIFEGLKSYPAAAKNVSCLSMNIKHNNVSLYKEYAEQSLWDLVLGMNYLLSYSFDTSRTLFKITDKRKYIFNDEMFSTLLNGYIFSYTFICENQEMVTKAIRSLLCRLAEKGRFRMWDIQLYKYTDNSFSLFVPNECKILFQTIMMSELFGLKKFFKNTVYDVDTLITASNSMEQSEEATEPNTASDTDVELDELENELNRGTVC